jgi:hypothetical protein
MKRLLVIEPNLRTPSGHYAEFVRALGARADETIIDVYAHPDANALLEDMQGVRVFSDEPKVGRALAEWRTIVRSVRDETPFLVLTSDGRHAAAVSLAAGYYGLKPEQARLYFHRIPSGFRDRFFLKLSAKARSHALAIAPTEAVADSLRAIGWRRVAFVPYPALGVEPLPEPVPFSHLLMAGAARLNKGLDLIADLAVRWAEEHRTIPLLVQVSKKHAVRHGHREVHVVENLLASGYSGLQTDEKAPDRAEYLKRFRGALVLAPYAREQFATQVSGIVLDALLHGAPAIATRGTWSGAQVERFGAGITLEERTPTALASAIDHILADWSSFATRACEAARILSLEHDPRHLLELVAK